MSASRDDASIVLWRLGQISRIAGEARLVLPVPRFQVRLLLSIGEPNVLVESVAELLRLGVGSSSGIADHLRVPEDMVRSALNELARVHSAEFLESEGRWRELQPPNGHRCAKSAIGWMLWNPIEDQPFNTVFLDQPVAFRPDEQAAHPESDVRSIEVEQPPLRPELVRDSLKRLNQRIEMVELAGCNVDELTQLSALHLLENTEWIGSGFGHLEWTVAFQMLADRRFDFTLYKARFHDDRGQSQLAVAPSGTMLRLRELYLPAYEALSDYAHQLEQMRRVEMGIGLTSESAAQFQDARDRYAAMATELGARPDDAIVDGPDRQAFERLYSAAAAGGEFWSADWFEWIREFGPMIESALGSLGGEELRQAADNRWRRREMRIRSSDVRLGSFGVFKRGVSKLLKRYVESKHRGCGEGPSVHGFRNTVNRILFFTLDDHPDARVYRNFIERLVSRWPDVFEPDRLDLLIELRNIGSHRTPWNTRSPEEKKKRAEIRDKLACQQGGLAQSTEHLTRWVFKLLSALREHDPTGIRR